MDCSDGGDSLLLSAMAVSATRTQVRMVNAHAALVAAHTYGGNERWEIARKAVAAAVGT